MIFPAVALAFGLLSLRPTLATPEFTNHGTLSGWVAADQHPIEAQGNVTEVTNVIYKGTTALKTTQTYLGTGYTGRYHSERTYANGYHLGDHKFYGFAFRLQSDWDFTSQLYDLAQWIGDYTDTGCDDWSPTSMVYMNNTQLWTRVKYGQLLPGKPCPPTDRKWDCAYAPNTNCQPITAFKLANSIAPGTWYKLTFEASWKADATGVFRVWLDDALVLDKSGIKTTLLDDGRELEFRVGLYANSWHDENRLVGTQGFRQVWYDEIGVGSAKADANP